jgi:hypothetical protein
MEKEIPVVAKSGMNDEKNSRMEKKIPVAHKSGMNDEQNSGSTLNDEKKWHEDSLCNSR